MKIYTQITTFGLATSLFLFTACGKPGEDTSASAEVSIPAAPAEAMKVIFTEAANGNGGIIWDAMPVSYQADVNSVVRLAGTKIDPEMYDKGFALVGRLGEVAGKQKDFILNTSMMPVPAEEKAQLEEAIPALSKILGLLASSDIATSAGLQSFDGKQFCETTITDMAKLSMSLTQLEDPSQPSLEDMGNATFSVIESTEGQATLKMIIGETEEIQEFTNVEGRWVPTDLATEWTQNIAQSIAELEAMTTEEMTTMKPQVMGVLAMVDGVLTQLESAQTQEQFDQALQGAMMPIMGLMMMGQGMGGEAPAMPMAPMPAAP